jgi:hypothetical protein
VNGSSQSRGVSRARRSFAFPALLAAVAAIAIATTQVAEAAYLWGYGYDGVNIRQCAFTSCISNGLGYIGQGACELNRQRGEVINGNPWWVAHTNLTTGVQGWSAEYFMYLDYPYLC